MNIFEINIFKINRFKMNGFKMIKITASAMAENITMTKKNEMLPIYQ